MIDSEDLGFSCTKSKSLEMFAVVTKEIGRPGGGMFCTAVDMPSEYALHHLN
jgi:hypothetical protein